MRRRNTSPGVRQRRLPSTAIQLASCRRLSRRCVAHCQTYAWRAPVELREGEAVLGDGRRYLTLEVGEAQRRRLLQRSVTLGQGALCSHLFVLIPLRLLGVVRLGVLVLAECIGRHN